jgi:VanZ like family
VPQAVPSPPGRGPRVEPVVALAGLAYLLGLGLGILLIALLRIVRYHTLFWQFTGRHLGLGWTAGRERARDAAVNAALFVPLGFLGHRWRRAGSTPSWATASATLITICLVAASMEMLQIFLPWRSASVADVFSDAIGAMAGAGFDALFAQLALRSRHCGQ